MFTALKKGRLAIGAVAVGASLALAGCASGDPLATGGGDDDAAKGTIVVGSQAYYSNEIIAEIYSQALENDGFTVTRQFQIGQRDAYLPELESGAVDLIPEYTGNLLQFYAPDTKATTEDDVYAELGGALPASLTVLEQSPATDQDSYNVTKAFAEENDVSSIADLAGIDGIILGGNAELETRPYGVKGLKDTYDVDVTFKAIGDSGGPLTVQALKDGVITVGNIYSGDPNIAANDLVTLEDPEGLFLASNVVPLVNKDVAEDVADVINAVDAKLDAAGLSALNALSVNEQQSSEQIATDWLTENGFLK
ncbi:ABC transporter substrate-binding protein [Glaciihabitans arcticus]|uniref:ABC transporter substrate-binding protein n=1 Tax=Glaciihabitans arcticus TaxID=2668039 RepID=A0A4Q9GWD1_9MICO|nr:ABC transporter substrate-binding protein [Glaciihabitans arcticus]TBN56993.1 ABC transporter substrate-binding protein [Glaciihabitans arcticus]